MKVVLMQMGLCSTPKSTIRLQMPYRRRENRSHMPGRRQLNQSPAIQVALFDRWISFMTFFEILSKMHKTHKNHKNPHPPGRFSQDCCFKSSDSSWTDREPQLYWADSRREQGTETGAVQAAGCPSWWSEHWSLVCTNIPHILGSNFPVNSSAAYLTAQMPSIL